jgi:hypothetical protein
MGAESRKRAMRFESVGTVPLPLPRAMIYEVLVVEGVFRFSSNEP